VAANGNRKRALKRADPFPALYELLRNGRKKNVLGKLYDASRGRIRAPFSADPNHAWYFVGTIMFDSAKYREAIEAFQKALRTRRTDVDALWAIGNCYAALGQPRFAARYFERALALRSRHSDALRFNLGNALFDQGRYEEALKLYKKVMRSGDRRLSASASRNAAIAKRNGIATGK